MKRLVGGSMFVVLLVGLALSDSGCALLVKHFCENTAPTNTVVTINSSPQGVTGKVSNGRVVTTPVQLMLKSDESVSIHFAKEGYQPAEVNISSMVNPWLFGDILALGPIGFGIDLEQGATRTLGPSRINLVLEPTVAKAP